MKKGGGVLPGIPNCYRAPFLWCYLANFGGHTHLVAPIRRALPILAEAFAVPNCSGVGSTLEGLNVNPIAYDLIFEQPWHRRADVDFKAWVADYATPRAGRADPAVLAAWEMLSKKVLVNDASTIWGHGVMLQCKPGEGTGWTNPTIPYKNADLVAALKQMLKADPACRQADGYQFDLVNLTRQAIGNQAAIVHGRMMKAVQDNNLAAFRKESALFLEMGRDIDTLMATRHESLLGAGSPMPGSGASTARTSVLRAQCPADSLHLERTRQRAQWRHADGLCQQTMERHDQELLHAQLGRIHQTAGRIACPEQAV